jgi:hypothetical protein
MPLALYPRGIVRLPEQSAALRPELLEGEERHSPCAGAIDWSAQEIESQKHQLGDRGRRVGSGRKTDPAGMGHRYSGSVPEGQGPIFLQAMGRRAKKARRANARR